MQDNKDLLPGLTETKTLSAVEAALHAILVHKGADVQVLDLRSVSDVTDVYIVATAQSEPQVGAVARAVTDELRDMGLKPHHQEGLNSLQWVLMDYFDVVVHVMTPRARDYYRLEELWNDAPGHGIDESYFSRPQVMERNPDRLLTRLAADRQTEDGSSR